MREDDAYPAGFFDRSDPMDDAVFYRPDRLVTHIDDGAIAAVGALYAELGIDGDVLDLMSSWVSHFRAPRRRARRARDERRRAGREPAGRDHGRPRPQPRPRLPFADDAVRRGPVLRLGRLPRAPGRGVRRRGPGAAARRPVRGARSRTAASRPRPSGRGCSPTKPAGSRSCARTSSAPAGSTRRPRPCARRSTPAAIRSGRCGRPRPDGKPWWPDLGRTPIAIGPRSASPTSVVAITITTLPSPIAPSGSIFCRDRPELPYPPGPPSDPASWLSPRRSVVRRAGTWVQPSQCSGARKTPPWPQPQWLTQVEPSSSTTTSAAWAAMWPTSSAASKWNGSSLTSTRVRR